MPYWVAFALTLIVELPIYLAGLTLYAGRAPLRALLVGLAVNAITHPIVWFVLPPLLLPGLGWLGYATVAELFAWGVESGLILVWLRRGSAVVMICAVANVASYVVGVLLSRG